MVELEYRNPHSWVHIAARDNAGRMQKVSAEWASPVRLNQMGITKDALAVKLDKESGRAQVYPAEQFRQVLEVNLVAPVYWAMEMVARSCEHET